MTADLVASSAVPASSSRAVLPDGLPPDLQGNRATSEHVTELVVLVALMGVGPALDRPLQLLRRRSSARWGATWRPLLIPMPLSIAGVAVLG